MAFPYDKYSPRNSGRHVPLHVAQQVAEERNQFATEVQRLRRENAELRTTLQSKNTQTKALERKISQSEVLVDELRTELEAVSELESSTRRQEEIEKHAEEANAVARLSRHIQELSSDLDRVQRRAADQIERATVEERRRLLASLGSILDSIERGLQSVDEGPWRQGLLAINEQFSSFLRAEGASLIGEVGQKMDPARHQALAVVDAPGLEPGRIASVERRGIELDDGTLVRPAQVTVAR